MLILNSASQTPDHAKGGVYAIGNFDGVHRGHLALLTRVRALAAERNCVAGVLTFDPHPRQLFQPDAPHFQLTPLEERLRLIALEGIDVAAVIPFDRALAGLTADEFVRDVLIDGLGVSHVVVGFHFHFGKKRGGTAETLQASGRLSGFGVTVIEPQRGDNELFSSSEIRDRLARGDVAGAARLLGRYWHIDGVVGHGHHLGTELGFPTANVVLPDGVRLGHGIYAVRVRVGGDVYGGAAYYGGRPTVNTGEDRLEVFLFDFDGDLYGDTLGVWFVDHLRGDRAFESLDALKVQIAEDCAQARAILSRTPETPQLHTTPVSCR